ncbi:MAG: hypothetical protein ACLFTU_01865 [Puniceicoccaceae bacterium]
MDRLDSEKSVFEAFRYLRAKGLDSYVLLPLDPDLAGDALHEDLSPLVWFSPNLRIGEVRRMVGVE